MPPAPEYPFSASPAELAARIEEYVDTTWSSLSSFYLELPRGEHFVEYTRFRKAYELLADATKGFTLMDCDAIARAVSADSLVFVVLRCIVALSPPELADLTTATTGVPVPQGFARAQDQKARDGLPLNGGPRVPALIQAACKAIEQGPRATSSLLIHRLQQVDTAEGLASIQRAAKHGVPYSTLLYERMLGRPFATHRDSVSEMVGDIIENVVSQALIAAEIPFHKTGRAERIPGFDQAPDFLVPTSTAPRVVIEAKLTQDDGTARDKVTRVQHLDRISDDGRKFEVVACIDGRGFRIRREDMKKLLLATRGKVFTVATMEHLVASTSLKEFLKR